MYNSSKKKLLKHYESNEPKLFIQYQGYADQGEEDPYQGIDKDGHSLCKQLTHELMLCGKVSVFIDPKVSKESALLLLSKITEWIKRQPDLLGDYDKKRVESEEYIRDTVIKLFDKVGKDNVDDVISEIENIADREIICGDKEFTEKDIPF